jgi:fructokinase
VCVGEALVDFIAQSEVPDVGTSEFFRRAAGGAVSNVAAAIARLGGDAAFVGTVSRDRFGKFLVRTLAHANVNVDGVRLVDAATTIAFVSRGPYGERDFMFVRNPGADSLLQPDDLDEKMLTSARALHFGGVLLAGEPARAACLAAAEVAGQAGVLVSIDVNVRASLFDSASQMRQVLLGACRLAKLVKLSSEDMSQLGFERSDPKSLLRGATQAVIVTDGANGCRFALSEEVEGKAPAPPVQAVDTTGAGDAFMGALLWRLVNTHGARLSEAALTDGVSYGCAAGALACLKEGAIAALPSASELEAFMRTHTA